MIADERRRRLVNLVVERGSASVTALADELGVSSMTCLLYTSPSPRDS